MKWAQCHYCRLDLCLTQSFSWEWQLDQSFILRLSRYSSHDGGRCYSQGLTLLTDWVDGSEDAALWSGASMKTPACRYRPITRCTQWVRFRLSDAKWIIFTLKCLSVKLCPAGIPDTARENQAHIKGSGRVFFFRRQNGVCVCECEDVCESRKDAKRGKHTACIRACRLMK